MINSDHLKIHVKTHDTRKPFQCSVCQRGYSTAAALTSHMLNHRRESGSRCGSLCSSSTTSSSVPTVSSSTSSTACRLTGQHGGNNNSSSLSSSSTASTPCPPSLPSPVSPPPTPVADAHPPTPMLVHAAKHQDHLTQPPSAVTPPAESPNSPSSPAPSVQLHLVLNHIYIIDLSYRLACF